MINGGVFTKGIPEALYTDLPTPKLSDTTEEKIRKHEIYDRLQPYAGSSNLTGHLADRS
jgi:hypothetical protein